MSEAKFILSKERVVEQYNILQKLWGIISYSYKTNNEVGKILEKETDSLFSIHMPETIKQVKDKKRIIFLAQAWNLKLIEKLLDAGITKFVVDNNSDLEILTEFLGKTKKTRKIELMLRVRLRENTIFTGRYFAFGMRGEEARENINRIRKDPLFIKHIVKLGIHFHRKTQNVSEWNLVYDVSNLIGNSKVDMVNIGGGFPIEYKNSSEFKIEPIFEKVSELKKWLDNKGIDLIIEPGRFIAGPAVKLETEIIGVQGNNIIVNASVYNASMDTLLVPLKLLVEGEMNHGEKYVIKGNTPCSMDIFRYSVHMKKPKVGEKIVFLNAGGYNFTTDFCNLEKIKMQVVNKF